MKTVAIVGVGLIGGSFGLALRKAGFAGRIWGSARGAPSGGARARAPSIEAVPLAEAAGRADLVYLSQPIGRILDTLRHLDPLVRPGTLVTDAGSTKSEIVRRRGSTSGAAEFLGGHPMAGKEKRGAAEADAELFRGPHLGADAGRSGGARNAGAPRFRGLAGGSAPRPVILTPTSTTAWWRSPRICRNWLSTALAATVAEQAGDRLAVAGPGLADMTRLALSSYELWRDILATNSQAIEQALTAYLNKLEHLRDNLRTREIESEFEIAAALAATLRK